MVTGRVLVAVVFAALVGLVSRAPARDDKPTLFEVEKHKDIAYRTDAEADKVRHRLDVYVPKGQKDFPVMLFVHGGTWKSGSKDRYVAVGEAFAKAGIGVVVCNYRLSPAVKHPAHVEDVAKAFAWTCENVAKYGGGADKLFVCGHSAGGHLVALLATDPTYLKAEKRSPRDIRGVIAISGVYKIMPNAIFRNAFGEDEEVCRKASPLTHADGKHPPFLIAHADTDYPALAGMAEQMHKALKKAESSADLLECKERNHITIITSFVNADDALNKATREFIAARCKK
jgi:acetyl esterase/lipase